MKDIRQNLRRLLERILLLGLFSGLALSSEQEISIDYDYGKVREVIFSEPWLTLSYGVKLSSVKILIERENGALLVPPYRRLVALIEGDYKTILEFEGHSVELKPFANKCFDVVLNYNSGSNLGVMRLFKQNESGLLNEFTRGLNIESNLGRIKLNENQIEVENQVLIDGTRRVEHRVFEISTDAYSKCTLTEQKK